MAVPARFERYVLRMRVVDGPLYLPTFKGGALRGAFGETFKRAVCVARSRSECTGCPQDPCPYRQVFETVDSSGRAVPRPFVLEPPEDERGEIPIGERFEFSVVLFGRALRLLPLFVMVFDEVGTRGLGGGKRGRLEVEGVFLEDGTQVFAPGSEFRRSAGRCADDYMLSPGREYCLTLDFKTPVQLREQGRVVRPTFAEVLDSLMRRLKLLYRFHSDERIEQELVEEVLRVSDSTRVLFEDVTEESVSRYSRRQGKRIAYDGFRGRFSVEGDVAPAYPWLAMGSYVHVGKGCTFGLGRYTLSVTAR